MKKRRFVSMVCSFLFVLTLVSVPAPARAAGDDGKLPSQNVWFQATPSVVWYGDPGSTTTLEVHIVGRKDVRRVWLTGLGSSEQYGRRELYDDGTHGDKASGDFVFTLGDVVISTQMPDVGYGLWWGYVRVELADGTRLGNDYGVLLGLVDPRYKGAFPVQDLGGGLSATPYAFFIQDSSHQVIGSYPVSDVYCGTKNYEAYKKLYSVFPDVFDFASLMPGMQIYRPKDLHENVPYNVAVSCNVQNIGRTIMDDTKKFGSSGRLKSVTYNSFGTIEVADHELGHTWGMSIGKKLGLINEEDLRAELGHWNKMTDIHGQMGGYYSDGKNAGYFVYNGDGTWRLDSNTKHPPYSPLELYLMGLIPSSEVPDVHILEKPDFTDPAHITAASYQTITARQLVESAGGERIPSSADSQKAFNMAFIVTQDMPYNDAAYAYFSLLSRELMSRDPPRENSYLAPFYWATGGRATLNTSLLDYGVLDLPSPAPSPTPVGTEESPPSGLETPSPAPGVSPAPVEAAVPVQEAGGLSTTLLVVIIGVLLVAAAVLVTILVMKKKNSSKK